MAHYGEGVLMGKKVNNLKTLILLQRVLNGEKLLHPSDRYQLASQYTQGGMVGADKPWAVIDSTIESKTGQVKREYKNKKLAEKYAMELNSKNHD